MEQINETLVTLTVMYCALYELLSFVWKRRQIQRLVDIDLSTFLVYTPLHLVRQTDQRVRFYCILFLVYSTIGDVAYISFPFWTYTSCMQNRTAHMKAYGISCGMITNFVLPFRYDSPPLFQLVIASQWIICVITSHVNTMTTMLICGILGHITTHLKHLKTLIMGLSELSDDRQVARELAVCVEFHVQILRQVSFGLGSMSTFGQTPLSFSSTSSSFLPSAFSSILLLDSLELHWIRVLVRVFHDISLQKPLQI